MKPNADNLRTQCLAVMEGEKTMAQIAEQRQKIKQALANMDKAEEEARNRLLYAMGARNALAEAILPEGMTLEEAWATDWGWIQSGGPVESEDTETKGADDA